jgi:hypothetical protein
VSDFLAVLWHYTLHTQTNTKKSIAMKKFFVLAFAVASFIEPAFAFSGETANTKATRSFNADYKGASNIWSTRSGCDEVLFFWHNNLMDSYYTKDGNLLGTFHQVDYTELPYDAQKSLATTYKNYHINNVSMLERPGQDSKYYATVQSDRHLLILEISTDGNVEIFKSIR